MKDLITTIGSICILMIFVLQFSTNQVITSRILLADKVVDGYVETLELQGSSDEIQKRELSQKLSTILKCEESEILIKESDGQYEVRGAIKNIVASGKLLGISEEENTAQYLIKGEIQ